MDGKKAGKSSLDVLTAYLVVCDAIGPGTARGQEFLDSIQRVYGISLEQALLELRNARLEADGLVMDEAMRQTFGVAASARRRKP